MDNLITDFSFGILIWQVFLLAAVVLWVYCLIDILRNKFQDNDKLIWLLVVLLLPLLGSLIYLIIGRKKKI